jgi:replicative DNA helicase Mcm
MTKIFEINERKVEKKLFCPSCMTERGFNENKEMEQVLKTQLVTVVEGVAMTSSMPISLLVVLFEDLLDNEDPDKRKFMAGAKIKVVGILKEMKSLSPIKKIYIEAMSWKVEEEDVYFSERDLEEFKKISDDKELIPKLVRSYAPSIYGYEEVKEGLILQIVGGVTKISERDKKMKRGNIHILFVGEPALAKSSMVLFNFNYLPKCKYAVCSPSSMTGAGLGVAMLRDKETDSWYLASGILVSASGSQAILDELDKADPEDIKSLDVVMEMCKLPVDKAGISIKLKADTSILGVANPKGSRFDPNLNIREQIKLNDVTISRFDLRYAFRDMPNEDNDRRIACRIINPDEQETPFTSELLFKYLLFARKKEPELTKETSDKLTEFYIAMRKKTQGESGAMLITARQLGGLIRIAEAYAKIRLDSKTNIEDAEKAIDLFKKQLKTFGFNPETGELDIDKAEGRTSAQERRETRELTDIYLDLLPIFGQNVPMGDFVEAVRKEGITNPEKKIKQSIREGQFIEPKEGFIRKA